MKARRTRRCTLQERWRLQGFNDTKVLLAALKREVAADHDAEAMQQHIAQVI